MPCYPQNGDCIVTIDYVTSLHLMFTNPRTHSLTHSLTHIHAKYCEVGDIAQFVVLTCIQKLNDCMNTSTVVSSLNPTFQISWTSVVFDAVTFTASLFSVIVTKFGMQTTHQGQHRAGGGVWRWGCRRRAWRGWRRRLTGALDRHCTRSRRDAGTEWTSTCKHHRPPLDLCTGIAAVRVRQSPIHGRREESK